MEFSRFLVVSFDCYGTLIDWEAGILGALRPLLAHHGAELTDADILDLYAQLEPAAQRGDYVPYREVLRRVVSGLGEELGFAPSPDERDVLVSSIGDWPPFGDTVDALRALKRRYRLAVISNIDDQLLARTLRHLHTAFDHLVTAEQCRSYKPSPRNFKVALERFGTAPDAVLHVAQSVFHDVVPASELGMPTVWVKRRQSGRGATAAPRAEATPDLEVPDLATLVEMVGTQDGGSGSTRQ